MSSYQQLNVAPNPSNAATGVSFLAGMMMLWGGATAPTDWLLCNGSAVSRSLYTNLFLAIGTAFGVGDGAALAFTSTTVSAGTPTQATINLTPSSNAAFDAGKTFTMTGGKAGYSGYVWTSVSRGANTVVATATSSGTPVIFTVGTDNTVGTITSNAPTTFNLPNTLGRTVRGVGTAGSTVVTLGGAAGADSKSLTIADIPKHGHQLASIGKNATGYTGGTGFGSVDNNPGNIPTLISSLTSVGGANNTIYDGGSIVATQTAVSFVNQYLGINYIIKI